MSEKIYYKPDEVWELLNTCYDQETLIAENEFTGVSIYAVSFDMYPMITVFFDDDVPIEEPILSEDQCEEEVEELYAFYLGDIYGDVEEEASEESEIRAREHELDNLVYDFVTEVTGKILIDEDDEIVEEIKERFLEIMYTEFDLDPYRPMILEESATGKEKFEEYPYKYLF